MEKYWPSPTEARAWLRAGLEVEEYVLVADLVAEGLTPATVSNQFEHPRTGERVTVSDVARNWSRDFSSLNDALDDALNRADQTAPAGLLVRRT